MDRLIVMYDGFYRPDLNFAFLEFMEKYNFVPMGQSYEKVTNRTILEFKEAD